MISDIIGFALVVVMSIVVALCIHYIVLSDKRMDEIERLKGLLKKQADEVFYSVHFQGKDLKVTEDTLNTTTYNVKWKTKRYNGSYNSMMINYNGLDPKTWYVLQLRTAYDVWRELIK